MKKKILITGGTGFIGYHLAKKCLSLGWQVSSISTKKPNKERRLRKINYILSDISKINDLKKKVLPNYNYVVNLAGYVDHSNRLKTKLSHYIGCKNLAKIFLKKKIEKFLQIGSCIEYGRIKSPQSENNSLDIEIKSVYGKSKLRSTKFLLNLFKKYNFPSSIIRLYLVYGPKQDYNRVIPITIKNCLNNNKFDCSSGLQFRDFTYVDDVVRAIILTLKSNDTSGKIINIGNGKPLQLKRIILDICKLIKQGKPQFGKIKLRKDEIKSLYPSILQAKQLINWSPKIKFRLGIKKTINYYKKINKFL